MAYYVRLFHIDAPSSCSCLGNGKLRPDVYTILMADTRLPVNVYILTWKFSIQKLIQIIVPCQFL